MDTLLQIFENWENFINTLKMKSRGLLWPNFLIPLRKPLPSVEPCTKKNLRKIMQIFFIHLLTVCSFQSSRFQQSCEIFSCAGKDEADRLEKICFQRWNWICFGYAKRIKLRRVQFALIWSRPAVYWRNSGATSIPLIISTSSPR